MAGGGAEPSLTHQIQRETEEPLLAEESQGDREQGAITDLDMPTLDKDGPRRTDNLAGIVALASIGLVAGVTWVFILTHNPTSLGWFAFHPLLQTLSLALLTYGIVTLQPTSQSQPKDKAAGLVRHQIVVLGLAFPAILVGTWAIWHNKNLRNAPHYTSWHGTFGGLCIMWLIGQVLLGAGSVWFKGKLFGGGAKAKSLWKYHRLSGYVLFPLMLFTAHLGGAWSLWAEKSIPWILRLLTFTILPVLVVVSIYGRVRSSKMRFR
ncbi:hypothetical protein FA15DRAFT_668912 [Coprinopsis marcescibilis]|uniref:Cytochrome b561 domain-containing protein n=1 Tax=Coprinopsis marcescibilis TaxID=230819 RepID=A0A5C3KWL2_COPMA|nr:hypothetical protein FA15DRAFT_668912 [Coprinopsis marcescibilis]